MRLYSQDDFTKIPWPTCEEGKRLKSFFKPIFQEGSSVFIANADAKLYILHIDDLFLPITVNEKEYKNSYVCSMYSFLLYAEEEMRRHRTHWLRFFLSPFFWMLKGWFRFSQINKLAIVNNFFLSTNLYPNLPSTEVDRIFSFLKKTFPDHVLLFRSLNSYSEKDLSQTLQKLGFHLITSRSIYFFDPKLYDSIGSKKRWIIQKDQKLFEQEGIEKLSHEDFHLKDAPEIKRLYDLLYLEKYSRFNPDFTVRFFEEAIGNKTFTLSGFRHHGHLVAVIGFFKTKNVMATPIVGYDPTLLDKLGLYRMLTAEMIKQSLSTQTLFHMSAGVGHFKRQRGAFQEIESMAVFYRHLPLYRRLIWKSLGCLLNKIGAPILRKYKF